MTAYDSWTFQRDGREFRATLHHDSDHGAPWDESDGHGEVTGWTRRDKRPGEMILHADRGSRRYYDFQGAVRTARRDGWGLPPEKKADLARKLGRDPRPGDIAHAAAMADYDLLRRWCNDDWHWCGVVVTCDETDESASLWGIESDAGDYLREVAEGLAGDLLQDIRKGDEAIARALAAVAAAAAGIAPGADA